MFLISYRYGRGLKCEPVYKVGSRLSKTGKTGNERANKMLDFKKLQDNEKKLFIEKVERMTKFLLLIKKLAPQLTTNEFSTLLDILFIDLFELKPSNKKEKK